MFSAITPQLVSGIFPSTPLANISVNLPYVLAALSEQNCDRLMLIMALATIRAETETFTPLSEFPSKFNTPPGGAPFSLYDHRADLGNQGPPDGERFRGRGYVQLTGRANYAQFCTMAGDNLLANPDLAADPKIAARILAAFLMHKNAQIRTAIVHQDLAAARRLVNGGTHGLERFTDAFQRAERLLPVGLEK
jgi:putative chitinase